MRSLSGVTTVLKKSKGSGTKARLSASRQYRTVAGSVRPGRTSSSRLYARLNSAVNSGIRSEEVQRIGNQGQTFGLATVSDRSRVGQAGADLKQPPVCPVELRGQLGNHRPRTHQAHVAAQHIPQLRKFVELEPAQPAPRTRNARIGPKRVGQATPGCIHGTQLQKLKFPESAAHPALAKDHRPFGIQLDEDGGECNEWKRDCEQKSSQGDIHAALEHVPLPKQEDQGKPIRNRYRRRPEETCSTVSGAYACRTLCARKTSTRLVRSHSSPQPLPFVTTQTDSRLQDFPLGINRFSALRKHAKGELCQEVNSDMEKNSCPHQRRQRRSPVRAGSTASAPPPFCRLQMHGKGDNLAVFQLV